MIRLASAIALIAAGWGVSVPMAQAASFDCAKAATPFEHAICDSPELSKADERLALTYATAIGGLSDFALGEMRKGQREWLDYARRACSRDANPLTTGSYDERGTSCLVDLFDGRSRVLETSRIISGLRFYPVSRYAAIPDPYEADDPDSYWPVAQHEVNVVQIDANEGFAHAFSDLVRLDESFTAKVFDGDPSEDEEDNSSNSTVTLEASEVAGTNLITLKAGTYWYGHGAAHGNWSTTYRHYLVEQGRWLEARDLFTGKGWQKALLDLTVAALQAEHGDNLMLDDTSYIADAVADPERWDLSDPYGLVIQFQPYEVSAYAYGAPTAKVLWDDLASYMTDNADSVRYGY